MQQIQKSPLNEAIASRTRGSPARSVNCYHMIFAVHSFDLEQCLINYFTQKFFRHTQSLVKFRFLQIFTHLIWPNSEVQTRKLRQIMIISLCMNFLLTFSRVMKRIKNHKIRWKNKNISKSRKLVHFCTCILKPKKLPLSSVGKKHKTWAILESDIGGSRGL